MSVKPASVLDADDLNETDDRILDLLREGRVTPTYAAEELGISREYASDRLTRFLEHDVAERIATGLYELSDDPRDD